MPGWLGAVAAWHPVSSTANAIRELFQTPGAGVGEAGYWIDGQAIAGAIIWPALIMAVFLPLAVRQFKNLSKQAGGRARSGSLALRLGPTGAEPAESQVDAALQEGSVDCVGRLEEPHEDLPVDQLGGAVGIDSAR